MFLILHITTAPYHPRLNGQTERFVDTFKQALKQSEGNNSEEDILQFLRVYKVISESKHKFRFITCRTNVCEENKVSIR